ncbi:MAG: SET domain-containing protein [bacterium]|nr:SET domain-containing protein [bacterium]
MSDIVVKRSKIGQFENGLGVFANRNFKKGEIVVRYPDLKPLTEKEFQQLPDSEKTFTHTQWGTKYLYPLPARYVNHSDEPNTVQDLKKRHDIATRDINRGEEITTDATKDDIS